MRQNKILAKMRSKLGQNTAEYLIMLVLVAVGSITMIGIFGKGVQKQFKNALAALEGNTAGYTTTNASDSVEANSAITKGATMEVKDGGASVMKPFN